MDKKIEGKKREKKEDEMIHLDLMIEVLFYFFSNKRFCHGTKVLQEEEEDDDMMMIPFFEKREGALSYLCLLYMTCPPLWALWALWALWGKEPLLPFFFSFLFFFCFRIKLN